MIVFNSEIPSYHNFQDNNEMLVGFTTNDNIDEKTLLKSMYKFCLICFVEAVKIIGHTLQKKFVKCSEKPLKNSSKPSWPAAPPVPCRTRSRIIKNSSKRWIKKHSKKNKDIIEVASRIRQNAGAPENNMNDGKKPSLFKSQPFCNRKKFGKSLNLSRHYLRRRHSYPPYRSSKLDIVFEEE